MEIFNPHTEEPSEKPGVLVADDDVPTRMLLRAAISQWGYSIYEASDGEEAWNLLQTMDNPPALIILDWMMPKLDGLTLAKFIKYSPGVNFDTFVILLTQLTGSTNASRALEAGADEFLSKPFNMAELHSRLTVGEKIVTGQRRLSLLQKQCEQYSRLLVELDKCIEERLVKIEDQKKIEGASAEDLKCMTHMSALIRNFKP